MATHMVVSDSIASTSSIEMISLHVDVLMYWIVNRFLVNDFLFYWAHRALHHPKLYGRIHKQHHLFKQTIGIAAEFAHPSILTFLHSYCC
jgi:sterol desaturase/sphingolipid hydroxylase (fatty acid hydroxylase superfamily)